MSYLLLISRLIVIMVREHTLCNLNSSNSFIILILLNWLRFGSFSCVLRECVLVERSINVN